jgi:hypothetical protein
MDDGEPPLKRIRVNCPDSKVFLIRVNSHAQIRAAIAEKAEAAGAELPAEYKLVLLPNEFKEGDWSKLSAEKRILNELTLECAAEQPRQPPKADVVQRSDSPSRVRRTLSKFSAM